MCIYSSNRLYTGGNTRVSVWLWKQYLDEYPGSDSWESEFWHSPDFTRMVCWQLMYFSGVASWCICGQNSLHFKLIGLYSMITCTRFLHGNFTWFLNFQLFTLAIWSELIMIDLEIKGNNKSLGSSRPHWYFFSWGHITGSCNHTPLCFVMTFRWTRGHRIAAQWPWDRSKMPGETARSSLDHC